MAMSAEHRSKFAALYRQWWRLHFSEKSSSGTKNSKQTNITLDVSDLRLFLRTYDRSLWLMPILYFTFIHPWSWCCCQAHRDILPSTIRRWWWRHLITVPANKTMSPPPPSVVMTPISDQLYLCQIRCYRQTTLSQGTTLTSQCAGVHIPGLLVHFILY